jgi:hypothetical protein
VKEPRESIAQKADEAGEKTHAAEEEGSMEIWKWAKANGIDHGLPYDEVHDLINKEYFSGTGKSAWIDEILAGRKTPFRELSNDVWRKQYNRRQAVNEAKAATEASALSPVAKTLKNILAIPRGVATFAHGVVFPITHGGELLFRPASWKVIGRGLLDTWTKSGSKAATEQLLNTMKNHEWFDMGIRSGLDVMDKAHETNLFMKSDSRFGKLVEPLKISKNAWLMIKVMRFNLWTNQMKKFIKPGMTNEAKLEIGKNLAEWANHATGSGEGFITKSGIGKVMFGPKITQAKLNRVFLDPVKTGRTVAQVAVEKMKLDQNKLFVKTFGNWEKATPGERAVAKTRLAGLTQYLIAGSGFLAANQ